MARRHPKNVAQRFATILFLCIYESASMKEFYVVNGDHVEKKKLRETPKFYIDDSSDRKFKKVEGRDYLGHYRYNGGGWSGTSYYLYNLEHEKPKQLIEKNNRSIFAYKVKKAAEEKISNAKTYSDFIELNKILNLGIDI